MLAHKSMFNRIVGLSRLHSTISIPIPVNLPRKKVYEDILQDIESLLKLPKQLPALNLMPQSTRIQYVSDLHVDVNKTIPKIEPVAETLAICGDIGNPTHQNFDSYLRYVSPLFDNIFFVPGNHDYDCGPIYDEDKVDQHSGLLEDICSKYANVVLLNNSTCLLKNNLLLAGCTLWSNVILKPNNTLNPEKYEKHLKKHLRDVMWINNICRTHYDKKIIMLTHFVPSFKLIEQKYLEKGIHKTSAFASNLDHLINDPVVAWLCGHSHSELHKYINGVYCGINAHGYSLEHTHSKDLTKTMFVEVF